MNHTAAAPTAPVFALASSLRADDSMAEYRTFGTMGKEACTITTEKEADGLKHDGKG